MSIGDIESSDGIPAGRLVAEGKTPSPEGSPDPSVEAADAAGAVRTDLHGAVSGTPQIGDPGRYKSRTLDFRLVDLARETARFEARMRERIAKLELTVAREDYAGEVVALREMPDLIRSLVREQELIDAAREGCAAVTSLQGTWGHERLELYRRYVESGTTQGIDKKVLDAIRADDKDTLSRLEDEQGEQLMSVYNGEDAITFVRTLVESGAISESDSYDKRYSSVTSFDPATLAEYELRSQAHLAHVIARYSIDIHDARAVLVRELQNRDMSLNEIEQVPAGVIEAAVAAIGGIRNIPDAVKQTAIRNLQLLQNAA